MLKEVVYSEAGRRMTFHVSGEIGGITETLGVWKDRALKAPSTELTTTTLRDLLARENAPAFIHFISLDIEGAELEALKAFLSKRTALARSPWSTTTRSPSAPRLVLS